MKNKEKIILDNFNLNYKLLELIKKVLGRVLDVFEE